MENATRALRQHGYTPPLRRDGRPVDAGWHRRAGRRRLMHDDGVSHTSACHLADDVDVKGVSNVAAAVLPQMIKQQSGHVFNTSSIAGRKVFGQGFAVSSASKFAVTAFTEGLRMEVGKKHNIRVNRASSQPSFRHRPPARNIRP
ncbi:SDR family oxidoreductase [Xanthomonas arboricola]|uniref:SDR family oxidoreductase n=1 Tax=Xanthomonas arboricola TaxID=56448 RepID=UPI0017C5FDCC|nr:SDR family NAD(P)-dependent oxidoreductase [Xanthomonas arboricola]